MPRFRKRHDGLEAFRSRDALWWVLSILALGLLGALVVPMFGGVSPWVFAFAYYLAIGVAFAFILLIVIPRFPPYRPTPFRIRNGSDKKLKRFKVDRTCDDGTKDPLIDADFTTISVQDPFDRLLPGHEELFLIQGDDCSAKDLTVSVTIEHDDGTTTTCSSDTFAVQQGTQEAPECTVEIVEEFGKWYARLMCPGMEPPTITIDLKNCG